MQLVLRDRQITHGIVSREPSCNGLSHSLFSGKLVGLRIRSWQALGHTQRDVSGNQEATNTMLNTRGSGQLAPSASVPPLALLLPIHPLPPCSSWAEHLVFVITGFHLTDFRLYPIYQDHFEPYYPKGLQSSLLGTMHVSFQVNSLFQGALPRKFPWD